GRPNPVNNKPTPHPRL
uniref:Formaecin-1 n=1 Tax=Myrmecia gulosa TaxID=36170 RepID=FORM1_MYRGU|nr:RecName: Full=Formaecin-1 [Myrmecia gulosa]